MTLSASSSRNDYVASGSNATFTYTFRIYADTEILVYIDGVLKTLGPDYSVTGVGADTGSVIFTSNPSASAAIALVSNIPYDQGTDLPANDPFPSSSVESALDKGVRLIQQLREALNRKLGFATSSALTNPTIPDGVAGKFLRWTTDTVLGNSDVVPAGSLGVPVALSDGGTGATTAAGARTNLGLPLPLAVASGGTGAVTVAAARAALNVHVVSPVDFGFATGASGATNRAAIQSAHDALTAAGGVILLPPGTFALDSTTINITKPVTVVGSGMAANQGTVLTTPSATIDVFTVNVAAAVHFEGFTIGTSTTRTAGAYIHFVTTQNQFATIRDMIFSGGFYGLDMQACTHWSVSGCYFANRAVAGGVDVFCRSTVPDAGGLSIDNCIFDSGGNLGDAILLTSGGGLRVTGNQFLRRQVGFRIDWSSASSSSEILVQGNSFDGAAGASDYGVLLASSTTGQLSFVQILNNNFTAHLLGEIVTGGTHPSTFDHTSVIGNTFQINDGVTGISSTIGYTLFQANTFRSLGTTAIGIAVQAAATDHYILENSWLGTWSSRINNVGTNTLVRDVAGMSFALLGGGVGAAKNGSEVYVTDGTFANPVAGGGTGCFAKRINGAWRGD